MNATGLRRTNGPGAMLRRFPWGEDFDQMFGRMFGEPVHGWFTKFPQVDLSETDKDVEVRMDVPGFKADQLDVQLHGDELTVVGKQEERKEEKDKTFHVVERQSGSFSRSVSLPCSVDANAINAEFVDGVLTVRLPKSADAATKKIQIKS
jgi:HSP20 family protein